MKRPEFSDQAWRALTQKAQRWPQKRGDSGWHWLAPRPWRDGYGIRVHKDRTTDLVHYLVDSNTRNPMKRPFGIARTLSRVPKRRAYRRPLFIPDERRQT